VRAREGRAAGCALGCGRTSPKAMPGFFFMISGRFSLQNTMYGPGAWGRRAEEVGLEMTDRVRAAGRAGRAGVG
jgi:hypothetical protein